MFFPVGCVPCGELRGIFDHEDLFGISTLCGFGKVEGARDDCYPVDHHGAEEGMEILRPLRAQAGTLQRRRARI